MLESILEILKYVLPSTVVFATAYFIFKAFLKNELNLKDMQIRQQNQNQSLPIRLQAYERLALLMERVSPNQLVTRVYNPEMNAKQLQYSLLATIKQEFEHNLSQQIYVSPQVWQLISITKDQLIQTINLVTASLPQDASAEILSKALLEFYLQDEFQVPNQKALKAINIEVRNIF